MNNKNIFVITKDVIDECLADSIDKASKLKNKSNSTL